MASHFRIYGMTTKTAVPFPRLVPLLLAGAFLLPAAGLVRAQTNPPTSPSPATGKPITKVAEFPDYQVTGVAVSKTGRLFVNFPRWTNEYKHAVVEVLPDGTNKPFPDERWNSWQDKDPDVAGKFVCVQSVVVDDNDALWIVDAGNPGQQGTLPGAPKLLKVDLKTNAVTQTIPFGADVCPAKSYLNDVRFDVGRQIAYLTESGVGAIVVVDLKTGKARRVLDKDKSVLLENGITLTINGKEVMTAEKEKPKFNVDGLALSPDNKYLYYQALMGATLYRIETEELLDAADFDDEDKDNKAEDVDADDVEKVATLFPVDAIWMDKAGNLYLSDLRGGAIQRRTPEGKIELVAADPRIQWPDSFAQGPDGAIYFTCSHIHHMARYNGGKSARTTPYAVFKVMP